MTMEARNMWSDLRQGVESHLQGVEWNLNGTLSMLRRRWTVLAGSLAAFTVLTVVLLLVITPKYTATTLLQINTRQEQVVKVEEVMSGLSSSDAAIRTEIDVLTSRKLASRVIDKLNLMQNADFTGNVSVLGEVKSAIGFFLLPLRTSADNADAFKEREYARTRAINALLDNLRVDMRPRSYSIVLNYTSPNPQLSAQIANTFAQEYLNSQLEDRFEATRRANAWINERLKQLQKSVQASELAVQKFREKQGLTEAKGVLLSEQQLSELNSQLILARTQLAEAQARFQRTKQLQASGRGIESAVEVLNSPLIMNLREQEATVRQNMSDLASRYGERHPRMVNIRNQLADLQRKIHEEINKIQGSLENNVAVAQARVATLEDQLEALQAKTSLSTDANVQLAELERQAQAEKTLYESFLSRSKEIAQMDFAQTDARIISTAEVPLKPSSPKKLLILALAFIMGAGTGVGLMLLLEMMDSGFRTAAQLEEAVKTPVLGLLGELPADCDVVHYVVDKPTGAFTEGVRAVRTALQFANPDKETKVIVISSSVPQEGKSLFALSLAQLTASGGAKVLLIDADMRRPSVARQLDLKPKAGLAELLAGQAKEKDAILELPKSKLSVLPALANTQFAQELLGSRKMADMMAAWRKQYDLIVIDSPPVMAVADAITLSSLSDALLFMVRWGSTPRPLVANAIKQLKACNAALAGCVVTRVDMEKQHAYGYGDYGYYYGKYKEYYSD